MQNQIKIISKLYEMRDAAKKVYGAKWQEKTRQFRIMIQLHMNKYNCSELDAASIIAQDCPDMEDRDIWQMNVYASVMEMIDR